MKLPQRTLLNYSTSALDDTTPLFAVTFGRDVSEEKGQLRAVSHEGMVRLDLTRGDVRTIRDTLNEVLEDWQ